MRQTLIRIPLDGNWSLGPLGEWPGFGFGIVLGMWIVLGAYWLFRHRHELRQRADLIGMAGFWCAIAVGIVLLPRARPFFTGIDSTINSATAVLNQEPRSRDALFARAMAYHEKREFEQEIADLKRALEVDPAFHQAYDRLAWTLATSIESSVRDGNKAVEYAMKANDMTGHRAAEYVDTLGAAQAEAGKFEAAVVSAEQAAVVAWNGGKETSLGQIAAYRERLRFYQANKPYRETTTGWFLPVRGYGFMLFVGFVTAGWAATRRAALVDVHGDVIWDLALWLFLAGIAGARAYYCVQYADRVFYNKIGDQHVLKNLPGLIASAVNLPDGGLVLYGGLLMGAVAYFIFCWRRKQNPLLLADIVIPSVFIGVAFGRIGCFMNGCCYGDRCTLPWGVTFPLGSFPDMSLVERGFVAPDQPFSLSLHPTQLYSSLDAAILALLTHAYFRYRHRNGSVLALGLLTYPVTRFTIELLRGDELGQLNTSLTTAQLVSVGLFITGLIYAVWLSRRPALLVKPPA